MAPQPTAIKRIAILLAIFTAIVFVISTLGGFDVLPLPHYRAHFAPRPDGTKRLLRYAVLGDSWASGINYGPPSESLEYDFPNDAEVCRCRRINEAWPVQFLRDNSSSLTQKYEFELDYQACHGAFFTDIPDQVRRLEQRRSLDFAFLMIGGNPSGFPAMVDSCLVQGDIGRNYGPEYPHPDAACTHALEEATNNVRSPQFAAGLLGAVETLLNAPPALSNPLFKLYVVGYSEFFNAIDDACDKISFGIWPHHQHHLTRDMRSAFNNVLKEARAVYEHRLNGIFSDPRVKFLDAKPVLDGHRFCEPTPERTREAQAKQAWLWDFAWPGCLPLPGSSHAVMVDDLEGRNSVLQKRELCRKCDGPLGIGELGEMQRPFHPKAEGHAAFKDFLIKAMEEDWGL